MPLIARAPSCRPFLVLCVAAPQGPPSRAFFTGSGGGFEVRTFECSSCGRTEKNLVWKVDRMKTDTVGWPAGNFAPDRLDAACALVRRWLLLVCRAGWRRDRIRGGDLRLGRSCTIRRSASPDAVLTSDFQGADENIGLHGPRQVASGRIRSSPRSEGSAAARPPECRARYFRSRRGAERRRRSTRVLSSTMPHRSNHARLATGQSTSPSSRNVPARLFGLFSLGRLPRDR
jgi:hypothetical protein